MKKMIFAMMVATGVLATGFANAQEKVKQETAVKKEARAGKGVKVKNESKAKTRKAAKDITENKAKKKEATVMPEKAKAAAPATK